MHVALLRARGHAGGRADALHVDQHRGNFGVVGQAQQLVHERDAGAGGGRERARAVPGRADHHADGRQFVLGLQDQKLFLPVSGSLRYFSQNILNASITEVDGVIGYQAATVAPAYTQPSAVAVLPSIRILSPLAFIFSRWNGSGHCEMLFGVVVAEPQRLRVGFAQRFLGGELFVEQLLHDRPYRRPAARPAFRRRRCSSSESARADP